MKLKHSIEIKENIITAKIAVDELGDATRDADTELNQLHNFVREIEYSKINFTGFMKLVNGLPVVFADNSSGDCEEIEITDLINKKYVIDENLAIDFEIDVSKIPTSNYEGNTIFDKPELYGEALAVLFINKIEQAISEKLAEIRALDNDIEKETSVII